MLSSHNPGDLLPKDLASLNPWARRLLLLRILLISVILIGILFWFTSFLIVPILIVLVAALLAYALVPVIDLSPRILGHAIQIRPVITLLAMIAGSQLFGIWGAIFGAPTAGLIQALVGAYWQYYKKMHAKEFPLENIEQAALSGEQPSS
jgi:predicted PurR-regulated permease PerM